MVNTLKISFCASRPQLGATGKGGRWEEEEKKEGGREVKKDRKSVV